MSGKTWEPVGYWNLPRYQRRRQPFPFIGKTSYQRAAAFLDLEGRLLEDWGGANGFVGTLLQHANYRIVDGSHWASGPIIANLEEYTSQADCILIRHILEHNYGWRRILSNALSSFRERLCLILFEPAETTRELAHYPLVLAISVDEVREQLQSAGVRWREEGMRAAKTIGGQELLFYVER